MKMLFTVDTNNRDFMETRIDNLFNDGRTQNVLKRCGLNTVGDIVNKYDKEDMFLNLRNCGANTAHKIMQTVMNYYLEFLDEEEVVSYYILLAAMNPGLNKLNTQSYKD